MQEMSMITVEVVGNQLNQRMFCTILNLACDVIAKEMKGARFDIYGICTGEMEVLDQRMLADYYPNIGTEYLVKGELEFLGGKRTSFKFFLPKEAKEQRPLVENFEQISRGQIFQTDLREAATNN